MDEKSMYHFCISACIFLIIIGLTMNLVSTLGVFDIELPATDSGNITSVNSSTGKIKLSSLMTGTSILDMLNPANATGFLALIGGLIVGGICIASGNYSPLAVYLFSIFFWASWSSNIIFLSSIGFLDSPTMISVMTIIVGVMTCLFFGAIIGIWRGTD